MNQKEIRIATAAMQNFLVKLALCYNANFYELEEITKRALGDIESGDAKHG